VSHPVASGEGDIHKKRVFGYGDGGGSGDQKRGEGKIMKTLWILAVLWTLPWKGVALWRAARNYQKGWYVGMLVLQTLGVLEILYIFFFQKDKNPKHILKRA